MTHSHHRALLVAMLAVGLGPTLTMTVVTVALLMLTTDVGRALPIILLIDGLLVLSAGAFAWRMASALASPVGRLRDGASLIAGPNPDHRIEVTADDDLKEIARHLNALGDTIRGAGAATSADLATAAPMSSVVHPCRASRGDGDFAASLASAPGPVPVLRRSLRDLSYAVIDLEATGLDPAGGDRVVSIASVRVRAGRVDVADRFSTLVNPGRPIPASSTRIHGVDDAMVRDMPPLDQVLRPLLEHVGESVLVGHVVEFDLAFLEPALHAARLPSLRRHGVLDTLALTNALLPSLRATTLEQVAALFGVTVVSRHSALGDASTTAEVLSRLIDLLEQRGIRRLDGALGIQRSSALSRALRGRSYAR